MTSQGLSLLVDTNVLLAALIAPDTLPWLHRDPFDRLLLAQAISLPARLVEIVRSCQDCATRKPLGADGTETAPP